MHRKKLIAAAVVAAALMAVPVAIAEGSSATHSSAKAHRAARRNSQDAPPGGMAGHPGGPLGAGGQAVHSVSVVLDKAGTGFITQTTDSGKIESVDAGAGTIKVVESSGSVTYQTATLTIPDSATVTLDGKTSSLSDLAAGDHVTVSASSDGTTVFATDSSFQPQGGPGNGGQGGPGGPPGRPGMGGTGPTGTTTTTTTTG